MTRWHRAKAEANGILAWVKSITQLSEENNGADAFALSLFLPVRVIYLQKLFDFRKGDLRMKRLFLIGIASALALQLAACAGPVSQAPRENAAEEGSLTTTGLAVSGQQLPGLTPLAAAAAGNSFWLDPVGDYELYAYDAKNYIYANLGCASMSQYAAEEQKNDPIFRVIDAINGLPKLSATTVPADAKVEGGFLTVAMDGSYTKRQYYLKGGALEVDGTAYALTREQYDSLKALSAECVADGGAPQWLVFMNPRRVTEIRCRDTDGKMKTMKTENLPVAASEPRYIRVSKGKAYTPGAKSFSGMFKAVYTFDNGVTYTVAAKGTKLYVESSDMQVALQYTGHERSILSYIESTQGMISGPANPRTGKPVIYLYPEETTDVEVKLDFQGQLAYTYPAYEDGWRVTARPDGTLTNRADGSTHYYLFWDGTAYRQSWDFSSGFVVAGDETESFLRETLPRLGLTPREYNDFITYWTPELRGNAYNLITFSTGEYEQTAPLSVTPAPDTVIRVHMVYRPLERPVDIPAQELPETPGRDGFTVVEWGGTRAGGMTR